MTTLPNISNLLTKAQVNIVAESFIDEINKDNILEVMDVIINYEHLIDKIIESEKVSNLLINAI